MTTSGNGRPDRRSWMSRRGFVTRAAAFGAIGMGLPSFFAACSAYDGGQADDAELTFDNWPAYIDEETVGAFKEDTGITLNYSETLNDNQSYFAKVVPSLSRQKRISADVIAPTFWMASRFISLGWVQKLPLDRMPNAKANLREDLRDPVWDPTGEYTLPWQTGMTGIAYNEKAAGRELKSVKDLLDPEFNGRIGMLTEMRDTVGLILLGQGTDPSTIKTYDEAAGAFEALDKAKRGGQIRAFTGNDYLDDLSQGNFAACVGWSGDVLQLSKDNPSVKFVIPEEGGMLWADTMLWVAGSNRRHAVATWMDYVYDPANAARITAEVQYIPPVNGVREALVAMGGDAADLADDPLLFPTDETQKRLRAFANLAPDQEELFDQHFADITGA